jgi:lipoyl(octanoyl) transferase
MLPPISLCQYSQLQQYQPIYQQMREYTLNRTSETRDALWLLEHYPVFTQGQAGKAEHVLDAGAIPVIQSDRGGQVTYHGPGQLMIYTLFDLKRLNIGLKTYVQKLEQSIMDLLQGYGILAHTQCNAPGVYVESAKICSLGLRVRHQRTYHGMSLNVNMDLSPFSQINPCGFSQLKMTQIRDFIPHITIAKVMQDIQPLLLAYFGECYE